MDMRSSIAVFLCVLANIILWKSIVVVLMIVVRIVDEKMRVCVVRSGCQLFPIVMNFWTAQFTAKQNTQWPSIL